MKKILSAFALVAILPMVGCASKPATPTLMMGESVILDGIEDQRGNRFEHQNNMQTLLFVDGMDAKNVARESLRSIDVSCMEAGKLVYLADISGMPSLISNLIAIPKLRHYPYSIWLDREGDVSESLPVQDGKVTVIGVKHQVIESVMFAGDATTLSEHIGTLCPPVTTP